MLAASPAFSMLDIPLEWMRVIQQEPAPIRSPNDAINVFDFELAARKTLPAAHFGYLSTGTDDDATLRVNREGFDRFTLRPRRLVDVGRMDLSIQLLGVTWNTPILLCPISSQRAFHPDGELAVARAARARGHLQVLATSTSYSIEDVNVARGEPVWFQLYAQRGMTAQTRQILSRVENAGCPAVVLTVDILGGSRRETQRRLELLDTRDCTECHNDKAPPPPMLAGTTPPSGPQTTTPTWDLVKRLRDSTNMKVFIKGIVTREDAKLALEHGVDGVFVSNHGGRAENTLRSAVECLPEIVQAVANRVPVLVDSGFRRGTDIFKALALGATAVGIGRPYIWGLAAFGQEGVDAVLMMLRRELQGLMRQVGTANVQAITKAFVTDRFTTR
jgi:isopentenyl diphosphate isomerase/L-lactate dehydrogenase-like FMN-dependent dehydrogenase